MKKIYSLMSLLLVMASVSHGGSQAPEEDDKRWNNFGSPTNRDGVGNSPVDSASAVPPVLGAAVVGGLPAPVPLPAPGVAGSGDETNTVGAALPPAVSVRVPTPEDPWGLGALSAGFTGAFGSLWYSAETSAPADVPTEGPSAAPGGVAAHMVAPAPPPVVPAHLDEYFHSVPAGPAGDMWINDLDAYAAEGIRLATLWANSERDRQRLFPGYPGIHNGLVLTEPLLRGLGLSRILVDWTVSNIQLDIIVEKMSFTDPTSVVTMGMDWLKGYVSEQICGFTLTPRDSKFRISCIGAPQPKTVKDLVLEVTTLTNPDDILGAGRDLVASFGVPGENNPVLADMGLVGEEALINHQAKVKKRIDWIRRFLDASRPDAVAGHLGVGSLLVAICRQREEETDTQVPKVYGFNALDGINMANVTYKLADKAPEAPLPENRVDAYRLLIGPGLLQLQPQGVGTRVLIPPQAIPEPVVAQPVQALPAQDDFWNWSLSELFSRTWASFFGWPDFGFLWNWNFGYAAVQPETAKALSQRILEAFDIISMGRHVLWLRNQMVAAEGAQAETEENRRAQAAADAAAHAAAKQDEDAGRLWT